MVLSKENKLGGAVGLGGMRDSFANRACFPACMAQNERNPSPAAGTTQASYPGAYQDCANHGGWTTQAGSLAHADTKPAAVPLTACCWDSLCPHSCLQGIVRQQS